MNRFEGKTVVVTGSHTGLGKVAAKDFASEGAKLILVDMRDCAETVAEIRETGGRVLGTVRCDISNEDSVKAMGEAVKTLSGGCVDVLLNVAGINGNGASLVRNMKLADWKRTIDINLTGTMLVCRAMIPLIEQGGGAIVNVSSNVGKRGLPYRGDYVCSKWALLGFTCTLALELVDNHIRVNAVCPGPIEGERVEEIMQWHVDAEGVSAETLHREWEDVPMKRFIRPGEVAGVMKFLASDASSAMTGQAINVTGGFIMN